MWDSEEKEDLKRYLQTYPQKSQGYMIGVGDNPIRKERFFKNIYMHILDTAKDYAYIMTPYLIIDNEMTKSLTFAAKRGVDVRIILPAIPDKKIPYMLAKSHYKKLIESGVKIYEYLPGFIHAKTWVSDNEKAVVGSVDVYKRQAYKWISENAESYEIEKSDKKENGTDITLYLKENTEDENYDIYLDQYRCV